MSGAAALTELAATLGVQRGYVAASGERRRSPDAAVAAVLRSMGVDAGAEGERAAEALREWRSAAHAGDPVVVVSAGATALEVPSQMAGGVWWTLRLEDGREWQGASASAAVRLPEGIPMGYHTLVVSSPPARAEIQVLATPGAAHRAEGRRFGLFLPLYAAGGEYGVGDFTALGELASWGADRGGELAGSTPLFAAFLDEPFEPSPYAPVSRLYWNELYLDPAASPDLAASGPARALAESAPHVAELKRLNEAETVDHRSAMAAKRQVLEAMLGSLGGKRLEQFRAYRAEHPDLETYAGFRARLEHERSGRDAGAAAGYHAYVQWLCSEQLQAAAAKGRRDGSGFGSPLYMDMPLGVHGAGYDVWRFPDQFAAGVSVGSPPDTFFPGGQDWGFPPLDPVAIRRSGHEYWRRCMREVLRHAGAIRIDHVMSLHRLFWVPHGFAAADGVYVKYPKDELYAVVAIESQRHRSAVIGEDLGTVPGEVRRTMRSRGLLRTWVLEFELGGKGDPFDAVPERVVAGMNTHDMPTFTGFWEGEDIERRLALGLITEADATRERADRASQRAALVRVLEARGAPTGDTARILESCHDQIASSDAELMLLNLEDLWGEAEPQNVPGTTDQNPNWQRRARYPVSQLDAAPGLDRQVRAIAGRREAAA